MEVATPTPTATTPTAATAAAAASLRLLSMSVDSMRDDTTEANSVNVIPPDLSIVFQLLSSDNDDDGSDDDDAATTMGSPIPAAQTLAPSLLSPEVSTGEEWTARKPRTAATASAQPKRIDELFAAVATVPYYTEDFIKVENDYSEPTSDARPAELLLSPASQLHVLSQISEMAESRATRERQAAAAAAVATCAMQPLTRPSHAWAPIAERAQTQSQPPIQGNSTKRKPPTKKTSTSKRPRIPNPVIHPGLLADVVQWEALNEPILEGSEDEEAEWSFEELSDSDF